MGKKENHEQDLIGLFETFFETGDTEQLWEYLISNSNLPGRRGNLELAWAFADAVERYAEAQEQRLWELCATLAAVSADTAPVNDPREFLSFCGVVGVGGLGSLSSALFDAAVAVLRRSANDPRWRMREAVAMGLQRLLARRGQDTLGELAKWVNDGTLLELRGAAAAVADPGLLEDQSVALAALQLHRRIIDRMLETEERRSEEFRILRKALGYTLSVVTRAIPDEGFEFMRQLVALQDRDVLWIVKENLKKNRLVKNFPERVESIKTLWAEVK